jgi:hypothetical protein
VVERSVLDRWASRASTRFFQGSRSSTYSKVSPTLTPISAIATASWVDTGGLSATGSGTLQDALSLAIAWRRRGATLQPAPLRPLYDVNLDRFAPFAPRRDHHETD